MSKASQVPKEGLQEHQIQELEENQERQADVQADDTRASKKSEYSADIFLTYRKNINKLFDVAEMTASQYREARANIQAEFIESCKKNAEMALSLQHQFWSRSITYPQVDVSAQKIVSGIAEAVLNAYNIQTQAVVATIDATRQNVKLMEQGSRALADLTKAFWSTWTSWKTKED